MNMNQIVNMAMRLFLRRFLSKGIDRGLDFATSRRPAKPGDPRAARAEKRAGQDSAKRARQAMRLGRRIGRF